MEAAFYKHSNTFEILPHITYSWLYSETLNKKAYLIMIGFLWWTFDVQWERKL